MKSVIFDFVTGAAIIMGLVIITRVMKANQFFIESSAQTETDFEQLYVGTYEDEGVVLKENTYTVADVYGTLTTLTKLDGTLMDKYEIKVRSGSTVYEAKGDTGTYDQKHAQVANMRAYLEGMFSNPSANVFKRTKTQKVLNWTCPNCGHSSISGSVWRCPSCHTEKNIDSTVIMYEFVK